MSISKFLTQFFSAQFLSVALVIEVGFIVGAWAGRNDGLTAHQWGGAAMAIIGAVLVAVLIHTWPEADNADGGRARAR